MTGFLSFPLHLPETVSYIYLPTFPDGSLARTGMAGVAGSLIYIAFVALGFDNA